MKIPLPSSFAKWTLLAMMAQLLFASSAWAGTGDLYLDAASVFLSDNTVVHDQAVKIYASVGNNSSEDILGSVQFRNLTTGNSIGDDQPVSVVAGGSDTVFVNWRPPAGTYTIAVTVYAWDSSGDPTDNNSTQFTVTVDYDYDSDGVGNAQDPDDDNDDVDDTEDAFPYDSTEWSDSDGDGIGDNSDDDDDNDGINDDQDELPTNPDEFSDTDGDGEGNNTDTDDDNDGLSDENEVIAETDPLNPDSDNDGFLDGEDEFPLDETEWADNDKDSIGDNADLNDDNDDLNDEEDEMPENHGPKIVVERYEEVDEETGQRYIVYNASKSSDPDGDSGAMIYRWMTKDGRLIGETAVLRLAIPLQNLFPSALMVIDDSGESRTQTLDPGVWGWVRLTIWGLLIALLIALAFVGYMEYAAGASKKKQDAPKPTTSTKKSKPKRSKTSTAKSKSSKAKS